VDEEGSDPRPPADGARDSDPANAAPPRRRSRYIPAVLDALIPGLGHLVAGRRRLAALFLAPTIVALLAVLWIALTTSGPRLVAELIDSDVIWALLALQGIFLVWRLLAVGSSLYDPALPRPGRRDVLPIAVLLLIVIVPQAYGGYATEAVRETADEVFEDPAPAAAVPSFSPEPDPENLSTPPPLPSGTPLASASPSASPTVPRVTGLIVGVDAGVGRNTYLTDTMIVVSLDPVSRTVSMISVPRDMVDVPFADGRKFRGKINSLVSYARNHPRAFPGSNGKGFDVLMNALGTLLQEPIQYYASVNLGGFVTVVNTLGGVNVNVAHGFCDPHYSEYGYEHGFSITAGRHHLNGNQALAYARVRKPAGESDFTRAARQQEVVSGIRDAIVKGGFINDPVGLIKSIGATVQTNVPRKALPDLAEAASRIGRAQTYRAVITQPLVRGAYDERGSIQVPDIPDIRALASSLFPPSGTLPPDRYQTAEPVGKVSGSGVSGCAPAAPPRPTAKPTPKPTAKPAATPSHAATPEPTPEVTAVPS
jgi:LCP family protein required for cell wall assembly